MSGGVKNSKTPAGDEAASCCETFNLGTGLRVKNTGESHKANDHAHDQKAHNHNKCSDDHSNCHWDSEFWPGVNSSWNSTVSRCHRR